VECPSLGNLIPMLPNNIYFILRLPADLVCASFSLYRGMFNHQRIPCRELTEINGNHHRRGQSQCFSVVPCECHAIKRRPSDPCRSRVAPLHVPDDTYTIHLVRRSNKSIEIQLRNRQCNSASHRMDIDLDYVIGTGVLWPTVSNSVLDCTPWWLHGEVSAGDQCYCLFGDSVAEVK